MSEIDEVEIHADQDWRTAARAAMKAAAAAQARLDRHIARRKQDEQLGKAAPKLLAACKQLLVFLETRIDYDPEEHVLRLAIESGADLVSSVCLARLAIAEATAEVEPSPEALATMTNWDPRVDGPPKPAGPAQAGSS